MGTSDYRMATAESVLRRGLAHRDGELILTLDPAFQGLPDTAHGGSVLAAFLALAGESGPHEVRGLYRKRVPLGVPLRVVATRADTALRCHLMGRASAMLVEGSVTRPAAGGGPRLVDAGGPRPGPGIHPLPVSSSCFACGVDNALGLRVQLFHDDDAVGGTWTPTEALRGADGALAPAALTTLLDEAAFWLGALASGESGMTTDLAVTLYGPVPFGPPIAVRGWRDRVRRCADDNRYWETEVAAIDADGRLVAEARITFVVVRGAARRLVTGMLAMNAPDILRQVFPAHTR